MNEPYPNPSPGSLTNHYTQATFRTNIFQHVQSNNTTSITSLFTTTAVLTLLATLLYKILHTIRKDYHAFLSLGPGGIPSTPAGYIHQCLLRPFALRDPLAPPRIPATLIPQRGVLSTGSLPRRTGFRPIVQGIAPQRQTTQQGTKTTYDVLSLRLRDLAEVHAPTHALYTASSCFEKHSAGIFCGSAGALLRAKPTARAPSTCPSEICHAHPSDGSLHLSLHPADVAVILERGWGQRHPLALEGGWCWGLVRSVPADFVMVYAPRDEAEMEVVLEIVRAAIVWVSGRALI